MTTIGFPCNTNAHGTTNLTQSITHAGSFRRGNGRASVLTAQDRNERYANEGELVTELRADVICLARHCQNQVSYRYAQSVQHLTLQDTSAAPSAWDVRLAALLHTYADFMPAPSVEFVYLGNSGFHGWWSPDGDVVVDVVTTHRMESLDPGEMTSIVARAIGVASEVTALTTGCVIGVRHLVLDAVEESTWFPVNGAPVPLHGSDIDPAIDPGPHHVPVPETTFVVDGCEFEYEDLDAYLPSPAPATAPEVAESYEEHHPAHSDVLGDDCADEYLDGYADDYFAAYATCSDVFGGDVIGGLR
jgi:hypothetical protein